MKKILFLLSLSVPWAIWGILFAFRSVVPPIATDCICAYLAGVYFLLICVNPFRGKAEIAVFIFAAILALGLLGVVIAHTVLSKNYGFIILEVFFPLSIVIMTIIEQRKEPESNVWFPGLFSPILAILAIAPFVMRIIGIFTGTSYESENYGNSSGSASGISSSVKAENASVYLYNNRYTLKYQTSGGWFSKVDLISYDEFGGTGIGYDGKTYELNTFNSDKNIRYVDPD